MSTPHKDSLYIETRKITEYWVGGGGGGVGPFPTRKAASEFRKQEMKEESMSDDDREYYLQGKAYDAEKRYRDFKKKCEEKRKRLVLKAVDRYEKNMNGGSDSI